MRFNTNIPAWIVCTLLVSCAGDPSDGSSHNAASGSGAQSACIQELDDQYRTPMIGNWSMVKEVFGDGSGERPGQGDFINFDVNGTYTARDSDREAGKWVLTYTSLPDGGLERLLLLFADHGRYDSSYWKYRMLTVTFADIDGKQHLVLTNARGGKRVYGVNTPISEY